MFTKTTQYSLLILLSSLSARVIAQEQYTDEEIVNAIWAAEGKEKAQYAYGIRSVKYKDAKDARRICLRSVSNNRKRWEKAGKKEDFIIFMGKRYCPPTAHSKNKNWAKNVKYFLTKSR